MDIGNLKMKDLAEVEKLTGLVISVQPQDIHHHNSGS